MYQLIFIYAIDVDVRVIVNGLSASSSSAVSKSSKMCEGPHTCIVKIGKYMY